MKKNSRRRVDVSEVVLEEEKPIPSLSRYLVDSLDERDRRFVDLAKSASERFDRLVQACLRDGSIDPSEAAMLVQEHNRLQARSRDALRQRLRLYGQEKAIDRLNTSYMYPESKVPDRPEPNISYAYQIGDPFMPIFEAYLDFVDSAIDNAGKVVVMPKQRRRIIWLMIVGPAIVLCALKLLGAI